MYDVDWLKNIDISEICNQKQSVLFKELKQNLLQKKYFCLFGAGAVGMLAVNVFNSLGIHIDFICDNDSQKQGKLFFGVPTISFEKLLEIKEDVVVNVSISSITSPSYEVIKQLKDNNFQNVYCIYDYFSLYYSHYLCNNDGLFLRDKLIEMQDSLSDDISKKVFSKVIYNATFELRNGSYEDVFTDNQYFSKDIIVRRDDEVFVDIGAYDGDTISDFLKNYGDSFEYIYAFELDINNYIKLEKRIHAFSHSVSKKIKFFNCGISDINADIGYDSNTLGSSINPVATTIGRIEKLDDVLKDKKVTFIKMDIEGAEINALNGAQNIIKNQRPKLSICIYHDPVHLWKIFFLLRELVPEYKFFVRHHHLECFDTVLYACI